MMVWGTPQFLGLGSTYLLEGRYLDVVNDIMYDIMYH